MESSVKLLSQCSTAEYCIIMRSSTQSSMILCYSSGFPCLPWWFSFCRRLFNTQQSLDSLLFNTQQSSNRRIFNTQQSYSFFSRG